MCKFFSAKKNQKLTSFFLNGADDNHNHIITATTSNTITILPGIN